MIKKIVILAAALCTACSALFAQVKFVNADKLTLVNKLCDTEHRYQRVDIDKYDLNEKESRLLQYSVGLILAFKTDSKFIDVKTDYEVYGMRINMPRTTTAGYDLYIRKDGNWLWAGCGSADKDKTLRIVTEMDNSMKECLLYMPLCSVVNGVEIGIEENAAIEAIENPFRHRIIIFGSSFTHGDGVSRSGMSYPMQMERKTGLQFISLGVSGNCTMQQSFAKIIGDNQCDALVLDAFSNPSGDLIRQRIVPFIKKVREAHPDMPIIFLRTIYRERSNFNLAIRDREEKKVAAAEEMMAKVMKEFDNVYFVSTPNQTGTDHETSVDGTHPGDLGYMRWAQTVQPQIVKILKKHGIK